MLDAAAGGSLMRKRPQEAYDLIEDMATNTYQYPNERRNSTRRDTKAIQEVDVGGLSNQIASQVLKTIEHKFGQKGVHSIQTSNFDLFCDLCGSNEHMPNDCQNGNSLNCDDVNFVGNFQGRQQNNPYSNTYNPGWRNHPNFSWANNQNFQGQQARQGGGNNGAMQQNQQFQAPQFNKPNPSSSNFNSNFNSNVANNNNENKMSRLEEAMANMMTAHASFMQETKQHFNQTDAAIKGLENQVGQLASQFQRAQGTLPSQTETNPKEQVKMIQNVIEEEENNQDMDLEKEEVETVQHEEPTKRGFGHRYEWEDWSEGSAWDLEDFYDLYAKNLQMEEKVEEKQRASEKVSKEIVEEPAQGKYIPPHLRMPHLLAQGNTQKERKAKHVKESPNKVTQDRGSFSIPCIIDNLKVSNALCDLGASINIMPLSFCRKLGIDELKPTTMELNLADHSTIKPLGIIHDILVKIKRFAFLIDFVVISTREENATLILGRPFLIQSRAQIDVPNGRLTLKSEKGGKAEFFMYRPKENKQKEAMVVELRSRILPPPTPSKIVKKRKRKGEEKDILPKENDEILEKEENWSEEERYKKLQQKNEKDLTVDEIFEMFDFEEKLRELALVKRKLELPFKYDDPGGFYVNCVIGEFSSKALLDTGASHNFITLPTFNKLCIDDRAKIKPSNKSFKMADGSNVEPYGVLVDIEIQVETLTFIVDLEIMTESVDDKNCILLGRSFFKTSQAKFDFKEGIFQFQDKRRGMLIYMYDDPTIQRLEKEWERIKVEKKWALPSEPP